MLAVLLICVSVYGGVKIVQLKGGHELRGEVVKQDDGSVQIKTDSGVVVTVAKDQIVSITDVVTPEDKYLKLSAKADPKSFEDQYKLAEWAFKAELYKEAKKAIARALKLRNNVKARALSLQIESRLKAAALSKVEPKDEPGPKPRTTQPWGSSTRLKPEWLVSIEDIYKIRLEEIREDDSAVSINFKNDVIERFIKSMRGRDEFEAPGADDAFRALSRSRKVVYMLGKIDRDDTSFRRDIEVRTDPKFMTEFRSRVWPIVSQYCAAAHCHGGDVARGGLKLFSVSGKYEKVDYTNFLILSSYSKNGRRLIYRDNPAKSLLLQYALPKDQAEYQHPGKIEPKAFRNRRQASYRKIHAWIRSLKGPISPNYRVLWKPPFGMKLNLSGRPALPASETAPSTDEKTGDKKKGDLPI